MTLSAMYVCTGWPGRRLEVVLAVQGVAKGADVHVAQPLHLGHRQAAANHLFLHGRDLARVHVAHRLRETLARRGQVAAVVQLADDVAEHGDALVAGHLGCSARHLGPRLGLLLDGPGQIAQERAYVHPGDARGRAQGGEPPDGGAGDLVLEQLEVWVVADEEILEKGMGGEQIVDLGAG